ncbi:hypothetical protein ACL02U_11880 [Streptomyces sp. MS06]|uniref:hypothetical protein n=1 Tax=Streptomyces sp. MS06 TaxID=3385974 RepID=UPI0039A227FA
MTDNPEQQRRPGEWPVKQDDTDHDQLYAQRAQERALWEMVLGSIRHHLNQQPSATAIRATERHWKNAITNVADELINTRRNER